MHAIIPAQEKKEAFLIAHLMVNLFAMMGLLVNQKKDVLKTDYGYIKTR